MSGSPWSPPTTSCSTGSVSYRRWRTPGSSTRTASDGLPRGRRSGSSWPSAPQTLSRRTPLAPTASTSSGTTWICCCSGMRTGLGRAWAWQIPLRDGVTSVGVVTDKRDFQKSGKSHEEFFNGLVVRNPTLELTMREAERVRPWYIEADYSYQMETGAGPGWLLIGDAFRFVDPIFSWGVDVALHSAA